MTCKKLKELLKDIPDNAEIGFAEYDKVAVNLSLSKAKINKTATNRGKFKWITPRANTEVYILHNSADKFFYAED